MHFYGYLRIFGCEKKIQISELNKYSNLFETFSSYICGISGRNLEGNL